MMDCAKTAEQMEIPGDPKNIVLISTMMGRGFDAAFAKLPWPLV